MKNFKRLSTLLTVFAFSICLTFQTVAQSGIVFPKFMDSTYVDVARTFVKEENGIKVTDYYRSTNQPQEVFYTYTSPTKWNLTSQIHVGEAITYYPSGAIKRVENYDGSGRLDGSVLYFTNEGVKKKHEEYNRGDLILLQNFYDSGSIENSHFYEVRPNVDSLISFYENGKTKQIGIYLKKDENPVDFDTQYKIIHYWNEAGEQTIVDGAGFYMEQDSLGNIVESGKYKDGLKDAVWVGTMADGKASYREEYKDGIFINGVSVDETGKQIHYDEAEIQPEFKGGMQEMYAYIANNIGYPREAQKRNLEGKVFCKFVVEKDGTIKEVTAIKGIHPSLDKEAIRMIKSMSGLWNPGYVHGQPVRVYYIMPINFKLN